MNPCGICRANNVPPPCRGHGGGSGGGGSDGGKEDGAKNENSPNQTVSSSTELASYLLQRNDVWSRVPQTEMTFKCENPESLLSIKLDGDKGIISLSGKMGLSADERKDLHLLFKAIIDEFEKFKIQHKITDEKFSATTNGDNLTIKIPNPKLYDMFVQRLMNLNLIPTPDNLKTSMLHANTTPDVGGLQRKARTPFDAMHTGPMPKGTEK